ncbi:MAG: SlyX family protein [Lysobacterales bacterium]
MSASLEDRLTELETRLAFVDDTVGALGDAIAAHDRRLYELRNAMDRLREELVSVRGSLAHDVRNEPPPPHY